MSSKPRMPPLVWSNQQDPGIVLSCRELQKFGTIQIIYMRNHIYTDYAIQFTAVYSIWFGMIWYDLVFETYRVRMSTGASTLHSSIINWITLAFARIATQFCRIVVLSCLIMFCQRVSSRRPKCFQPVLLTSPPPEFASRLCVPHLVFGAKRYVRSLSR
jgi:hypothetical protein